MKGNYAKTSRFLSLVLRHRPDVIGLRLDDQGWAGIDELIRLANQHGRPLSRSFVARVVSGNDKQRFAISSDGERIRARQGHSIEVDLGLPPAIPPEKLFHGTASDFVSAIRGEGLKRMQRRHVQLSVNVATAYAVGRRHGRPIVLEIDSGAMARKGIVFYLSENHVWLTDNVPPEFIHLRET